MNYSTLHDALISSSDWRLESLAAPQIDGVIEAVKAVVAETETDEGEWPKCHCGRQLRPTYDDRELYWVHADDDDTDDPETCDDPEPE